MKDYLRLLRLRHWAKNLLVLIPLIAAQRVADADAWLAEAIAFIAFSLAASAVYVLNDLMDLEHDRRHPVKRERPFASGRVPTSHGFVLIPLLLAMAAVLCSWLPLNFSFVLLLYLAVTTLYSWRLKQLVLWDVFVLASLYTVRIFAGATAIGVPVSTWLLAFSMFLFFSLALVKRYAELRRMAEEGAEQQAAGRGYTPGDRHLIPTFGISAGLVSVLVLALYMNAEQVRVLYEIPDLLWLVCVLVMFWITRIWLLAVRGVVSEDPVDYATTDPTSLALMGAALAIFIVAA